VNDHSMQAQLRAPAPWNPSTIDLQKVSTSGKHSFIHVSVESVNHPTPSAADLKNGLNFLLQYKEMNIAYKLMSFFFTSGPPALSAQRCMKL